MTVPTRSGVIPTSEQAILLAGPLGAIEVLPAAATAGALSVVLHPLAARALGSPVHTHQDEDEFSFVLEGTVGVQVGDTVSQAGPGDMICKPRGIRHAFWNPTDEPARLLEIITPGAFVGYFAQMQQLLATSGRDPDAILALAERYHLTLDLSSIGALAAEQGLRIEP